MPEKQLDLNPGPGPRGRKASGCRCLLWTVAVPLCSFALWTIGAFLTTFVQDLRFPHKALYQTGPFEKSGDVIRPLISDDQTFDMAVTLWLRGTESEEAEFKRLNLSKSSTKTEAASPSQVDLGGSLGKVWLSFEGNARFQDEDILETPLFSDIVFKGLRLSDRHVSAKIDFQLPTARFLAAHLEESDLRATFLLLPSSPSPIDYVKNFSSWMPDTVYSKRLLTRPWPFPLGSVDGSAKTMSDLALESFSISVPLIEFHDVSSQCNLTVGDATDDDEVEAVTGHPYVVTRTQLRIVRETRFFDAVAYNKVRDEIKIHSCGQGIPGVPPNRKRCRRTYKSNGIFETKLELEVPTESGLEVQWAYAPYMDTKPHSAGPLDVIPIPIKREKCNTVNDISETKDFMNITWRIAYAGRTPAKQILGDNFVSPQPVYHRASQLQRVSGQIESELWNGALGHRFHDDSHPRRRIALAAISWICLMYAAFSPFHYWWTRMSTVGISISSVVFMIPAHIISPIVEGLQDVQTPWVFSMAPAVLLPCLMCKAVTRMDFGWRKGSRWIPTLTMAPANHLERASQRVDSRTSWWTRFVVFFIIVIALQFKLGTISLIPSEIPAPLPSESVPASKLLDSLKILADGMHYTGTFSQVLLNHRSRTYGGGYRTQVIALFVATIADLLYFVPAVVGRVQTRMGLTLQAFVDLSLLAPLLWQALTLPGVQLVDDHE